MSPSSSPPQFQRARGPEAKKHRRRAILDAAARLARQHGVRAVTLTDIADAVGMHKSAMLRYFETREQIFLILTGEGWQEWANALHEQLEPRPDREVDAERATVIARVMARTLRRRPVLCDLLAQAPLNLERNVSLDSLRASKREMVVQVLRISDLIRRLLPLDEARALNVVATATSMAGALWQMAALDTPLRELYESDPELRCAVIDVEGQLTDILTGLMTGYLALGPSAVRAQRPGRDTADGPSHPTSPTETRLS